MTAANTQESPGRLAFAWGGSSSIELLSLEQDTAERKVFCESLGAFDDATYLRKGYRFVEETDERQPRLVGDERRFSRSRSNRTGPHRPSLADPTDCTRERHARSSRSHLQ